jgi:Cu2+-exporting ATPase
VEIVALDKTGTITEGEPRVTDILTADGVDENELLRLAAALEQHSEHPLSKAVLQAAKEKGFAVPDVAGFRVIPGKGLEATLDGVALRGGNAEFVSGTGAALRQRADALAADGKTPLYFSRDGKTVGVIAVADVIKPDSPQAVRELQNMGIRVVMLTGDNRRTAEAIGKQAGVDEVVAGVLPDGKEAAVRRLQGRGRVAMVGDGINDAPALTRADTGIAIGAGTDVAIDAADAVLMKNSLMDVPAAIRLSRATLRNIHENLFWAFFYNAIGIPLAAGAFIPFGITLHPMFGAAAMSLSSFCVVSNALRLNLFHMRDSRRDKPIRKKQSAAINEQSGASPAITPELSPEEIQREEMTMEKTMKIEGMMCAHCEARVKKALEALPEVEKAAVSHESGEAVVTLSAPLDDDALKQAVEAQDYKVLGVR